jgi:hypothetical protein
MVGLWLLVPEHLRLALQLIHEAALCVSGVRQGRTLGQKGFELANGLPFIATDQAIHDLLDAHTVEQARELQVALGLIRTTRGHFAGKLLAIDPHRLKSYSQRRMRLHPLSAQEARPSKCAQTFFALDPDTRQPVCLLTGTSARTVSQATPELLALAQQTVTRAPGQAPLYQLFYHDQQELGWRRAGTHNLNIRYGQMSLALLAQASLHQLRQRLGEPYEHWQASHLARSLLTGLEGDIRVHTDTILVTFYNAPQADLLRSHFENLPAKLPAEGVRPNIPRLYDFKLDFRFK